MLSGRRLDGAGRWGHIAGAESLRLEVLGPVRAWLGEAELALGPPMQRALLARLGMQPGQLATRSELIDALWGEAPPASAANSVHHYVAALRGVLEPGRGHRAPGRVLTAASSGYLLRLDPGQVDAALFARFLRAAREAHAAGHLDTAAASFDRALALWPATPLPGIPGPFAEAERARLAEQYWTAVEDRADALLSSGRAADLTAELVGQVRDQPLRERLHGLLMLSLYRSGRRAEALAVFRDARRLLVGELGIEPGTALQRLHQRILAADDALIPKQASRTVETVQPIKPRPVPPAPPRPPAMPPAQLPHDVEGFTGREAELSRMFALVPWPASGDGGPAQPGPVVILLIDGAAGVGKTALALHLAHRVAASFPGGQLFADLRGFTPRSDPVSADEALSYLLSGLGTDPQHIPADPDHQIAMYRTLTARRRVLIVLDNANSAEQVRPLLPGTGPCLVLITSRNRLDGLVASDGAHRIALGVLSPAEATALLRRFCRDGQVAAEPGAAADLARLCGYLPLALRIAAQRASARPGGTLADLAGELSRERGRLDLLAADDLTSVRVAFNWSYRALPPDVAEAFRMLGAHPGPDITAPAAAALLGVAPDRAGALLGELARSHLIEEDAAGRYQFHDLIRSYAAEQAAGLPPGRLAGGMRRLAGWYLHTADAADFILDPRRPRIPLEPPGQEFRPMRFGSYASALDWCDAERDNILPVTRHAADTGLHAPAWQLPVALFGYFYLRKPWTTWLAATETGLAAARRAGDPLGQAATRTSLGIAHAELLRPESAIDHLSQALPLVRELGHPGGEAIILVILGAAHRDLKLYAQAIGYLHQALVIWRGAGDRWGQAIALQYLGETHLCTRRSGQAITELREALRIRTGIGDEYGAAWIRHDLAAAHQQTGDFSTAVNQLHHALAIRRRIGDRWGEASTLGLLGTTLAAAGCHDQARTALSSAHGIFTDLGDPRATEIDDQLRRLSPPGVTKPAPASTSSSPASTS
ncbi:MAG TPA: BTAD domain-containing putative transcriptional regulator [Streptosporangiaceae bacterium]|jgi:DNA-binding SARP family transcriptional activator